MTSIRSSGVPHLGERSQQGFGDHLGVGDEGVLIKTPEDRFLLRPAAEGNLAKVVVVVLDRKSVV